MIWKPKKWQREGFRPFAPTVLASKTGDYFSPDNRLAVGYRRLAILDLSAAVCHEDATGRLHTVKQSQNAFYHDLIAKFAERSGTHVVLNTSFTENEPAVDTPEQAVRCFLRPDVDALALGPFVTTKAGKSV